MALSARRAQTAAASDPLWYKDAIFYELRVRSFADSDGDGIGDFPGLTQKLDYLQDLGVTTLWLLPFYPSPLRDDGYDIADYTTVDPAVGTLEDFKVFLREAHRRGLRVVTELVLNHTSDQHPWFQRARRAADGSRFRDWYVWSDTPERWSEARIIFKDFEPSNWTWDPVAKAYYWHRFYSHQPDLNFDCADVRRALTRAVDFWLGLGVDGLRLDAVPYLFERDGTNCENLPETHQFLKQLRRHVDAQWRDRMLLAEANQWSEEAVAYFGNGDECHMAFQFPVMPRLFMSVHMEDRFPLVDIFQQTPDIPETCQWALFLRNHDELTLEMVTDEERDYMYRVYASDRQARINLGIRRRLAPLLGNDRRRIELLNALLFSLPGTPVLYYGDEIGMGDNFFLGDRNGVRTPMQWNGDRNAGFSRANPQRVFLPVIIDPEYHYESVNVEAQQQNLHSLLWWMKRLIALRKRFPAFGRGKLVMLAPRSWKVLAFVRHGEGQTLLVVANLSRFVEHVELDLSPWRGHEPVELFGGTHFPEVGDAPYTLTLGPHGFYWFQLAPKAEPVAVASGPPSAALTPDWEALLGAGRATLERALPAALATKRWFGGKSRRIKAVRVRDTVPIVDAARLVLVGVDYVQGQSEVYALVLQAIAGDAAERVRREAPRLVLVELDGGCLAEALGDAAVTSALLDLLGKRRTLRGGSGALQASPTKAFKRLRGEGTLAPSILAAEQSNTSVRYDERLVLKLFRRPSDGLNPDLEVGRFLTERARFPHSAPVAGALEYRPPRGEPMTVGILHGFVPNEGDAWGYTIEEVRRFFERALVRARGGAEPLVPTDDLLALTLADPPAVVGEVIGGYLEKARLLGQRTAELHRALASAPDDPAFAPEPFGTLYQRALYQSVRTLTARTLHALRDRIDTLPEDARADARTLLAHEAIVLRAFQRITGRKLGAIRIRVHGDYHLGQVLHTGRDFVIIDFEGEPARTLGERRLKRSPLKDVTGMVRSFDYAIHHVLRTRAGSGALRPEDVPALQPWGRFWRTWVGSAFLRAYLRSAEGLVPAARADLELLFHFLLLEKSVYELHYELDNRPTWVHMPLRGVLDLVANEG